MESSLNDRDKLVELCVVSSTYKHRCPKVKFMKELRNVNMYFEQIGHILCLNISKNINKPFKVSMRRTNPNEIDLFVGNTRVTVSGCVEYEVV